MSTDGSSGRRVHVSEELLRAVLAEFKLELATDLARRFDNMATKAALEALEGAMKVAFGGVDTVLEGHGGRIGELERARAGSIVLSGWQRWFFGTVCVGILAAVVTLATVYR